MRQRLGLVLDHSEEVGESRQGRTGDTVLPGGTVDSVDKKVWMRVH